MKKAIFFFTFIQFSLLVLAQNSFENGFNSVEKDILKAQLNFLSSDYLEGRELGTKGGYIAAEYIASLMKIYGVQPLYDSYFQEFNLVQLNQKGENQFKIIEDSKNGIKIYAFQDGVDFKIPIKDIAREIEASLVFAGYGISDENLGYDDYKGIDAKGKIVLILDGFPGHINRESEAYKKFSEKYTIRRYSHNYSKEENARKHGAIGIIRIAQENYFKRWYANKHYYNEEDLRTGKKPNESFWDKEYILHEEKMEPELIEAYVSKRLANLLMNKKDFDFELFEAAAEKEMKPNAFEIEKYKVQLKTSIESKLVKCRNVCGIIKGKDTTSNIIVGAHYDHYGIANNYIWNGADDNGSGTTGMLTLARAFALNGEVPEHNLVFLAFDAEEKGLHGSTYFAKKMPADFKVNYMLNFDMISRNSGEDEEGNLCYVIYDEDEDFITENFNNLIETHNLNLQLTYYPSSGKTGGSDHSPFAKKDIPFSFFWSGWHEDYHNPSDEIHKINWDKMLNVCKLGYAHIYYIDKNGLK